MVLQTSSYKVAHNHSVTVSFCISFFAHTPAWLYRLDFDAVVVQQSDGHKVMFVWLCLLFQKPCIYKKAAVTPVSFVSLVFYL